MNEGQPIRDLVWDYVYGLLSPEENREMVARIKSDPQVARLYAEVRLQGELVAQAAIVEDSLLQLTAESAKAEAKVEPAAVSRAVSSGGYRSGSWLAAIAASALVLVLAVGFLWPRPDERLLARNFVCADVVAPSSLPAGLTNQVVVNTYRVKASGDAGDGAPAAVQLRLVDRAGKEQFQKSLQTDQAGQATVEIPGVALEPGAKLEVLASARAGAGVASREAERLDRLSSVARAKEGQSLAVTTDLPIEPEPQIAYSLAAEPAVGAAKDVPVSTWNFAAFSAKPTPADEIVTANQLSDVRLRDLEKATAEGATRNVQPFGGMAAGRRTGGQLRAENRVKQEAAGQQIAQVIEAGQPVQVDILDSLAGKSLDVAVQCRGVTVAATTEAEADFAALKTADRKAQVGQRQVTVQLPPEADGLMEVEVFDQASEEPAPVQRALVFRQPLKKLQVELPEFREQVQPGEEVEVKLRITDEKGQPAANARLGVRVWNERLVKQMRERPLLLTDAVLNSAASDFGTVEMANAQSLALNQAARADLARLTQQANKYQRAMGAPAGTPAAGADQQQRQMNESQQAARLALAANAKIELASNREAVKIALRSATDEAEASRQRVVRGLGIAAMVGGAVLLVLVATLAALRLASGPRTLALPLVTALASLLIGTAWLGWLPERAETQIALAPSAERRLVPAESNAATAESAGKASAGNAPVPMTAAVPQAAEPMLRGGEGGIVADAAAAPSVGAGVVAAPAGPGGAPASMAAAGAAPLGASAGLGGAGGGKAKEAVEMLSEKKVADKSDAAKPAAATPASLFFDPNLTTDAEGRASVRFVMPQGASEYRLLIDALGNGRIGSRQELIVAQ